VIPLALLPFISVAHPGLVDGINKVSNGVSCATGSCASVISDDSNCKSKGSKRERAYWQCMCVPSTKNDVYGCQSCASQVTNTDALNQTVFDNGCASFNITIQGSDAHSLKVSWEFAVAIAVLGGGILGVI